MSRASSVSRARTATPARHFNPGHQLPGRSHAVQPQSKSPQTSPAQLDISRVQELDAGVMRSLGSIAEENLNNADQLDFFGTSQSNRVLQRQEKGEGTNSNGTQKVATCSDVLLISKLIGLLNKNYSDCNDVLQDFAHKFKLHKEAIQQPGLGQILLEVAFGLLNPGLGRLLGGGISKLADKWPLDSNGLKSSLLKALKDPDTIKTYYLEAWKIGGKLYNGSTNFSKAPDENHENPYSDISISGDPEVDDFLKQLGDILSEKTKALIEHIDKIPLEQLLVLYYAELENNKTTYESSIGKQLDEFVRQVASISHKSDSKGKGRQEWKKTTVVYEVFGDKHKRLALLENSYYKLEKGNRYKWKYESNRYSFKSWISHDMKSRAIEKSKQINELRNLEQAVSESNDFWETAMNTQEGSILKISVDDVPDINPLDLLWLDGITDRDCPAKKAAKP